MTREIKFKAWNTVIGGWASDEPSTLEELVLEDNSKLSMKALEEDFTFMQYTGLKDKNGIEIYEGDVVRTPIAYSKDFSTTEVVFEHGAFYCKNLVLLNYHNKNGWGTIEVIGNIYENPELLEIEL